MFDWMTRASRISDVAATLSRENEDLRLQVHTLSMRQVTLEQQLRTERERVSMLEVAHQLQLPLVAKLRDLNAALDQQLLSLAEKTPEAPQS
ncbi:MAG: hypothetical protein EBR82_54445 [Caulobacteraceae bacterium]|nr:hypothetical protein [Caulobacteraceae bacterium]